MNIKIIELKKKTAGKNPFCFTHKTYESKENVEFVTFLEGEYFLQSIFNFLQVKKRKGEVKITLLPIRTGHIIKHCVICIFIYNT